MTMDKRRGLIRLLAGGMLGGALGLLFAGAVMPYVVGSRVVDVSVCLLCIALGVMAALAALPFADDGKSLMQRSVAHFVVTAVLFTLLMRELDAEGLVLIFWVGVLAVLYLLIWLGRWIGWYLEVAQLRVLLGLDPGPSPLKWRETLPYLPFVLLLCDLLPAAFGWIDRNLVVDVPVLSGLILPYLLLPAAGFFSGLSLGKRQGVCPLYPMACFVCYLPMVFLLFNSSALFHCFMAAVPALAGNVLGWLYRRAVPKQESGR